MLQLSKITNIYLAKDYVDFRKSIDGLVNIIHYEFNLDPYSQALFIFCNRNKDKLKIVHYDWNGFWLYYKRLDKDKFIWPDLEGTTSIELKDLHLFLSGLSIDKQVGFSKNKYEI